MIFPAVFFNTAFLRQAGRRSTTRTERNMNKCGFQASPGLRSCPRFSPAKAGIIFSQSQTRRTAYQHRPFQRPHHLPEEPAGSIQHRFDQCGNCDKDPGTVFSRRHLPAVNTSATGATDGK